MTSLVLDALLARGSPGPQRLPPEPVAIPPRTTPLALINGGMVGRQQPPQGDALMRQLLGSVIGLRGMQWVR